MKILALSSSRVAGGPYLATAVPLLKQYFQPIQGYAVFIPFALVNGDWEDYHQNVQQGLAELGWEIRLAKGQEDYELIKNASMILVGGGNTFHLTWSLYEYGLMSLIQEKVRNNIPYCGWSAGSNLTGMTIRTTNDMPIIEPQSFDALNFFPFQINPHYQNIIIPGFHGETRDDRLLEFCILNPETPVIGIPEGTALLMNDNSITYIGEDPATLFRGREKTSLANKSDLSHLLK